MRCVYETDTSGTGVAFTRDPATGEKHLMGEFLMNAPVSYTHLDVYKRQRHRCGARPDAGATGRNDDGYRRDDHLRAGFPQGYYHRKGWSDAAQDRLAGAPGDRKHAGNEGESPALGQGEEGLARQRFYD